MTTFIHQPHDKLFKLSMEEVAVAREFFATHLPSGLLARANLSTLELEKHSFIDEFYKTSEADVLYSVNTGHSLSYLYLLCEHQSAVDKMMSFRLLIYTVRVMEMHLKQYPNASLPVVYPIVVYSGEKPWTAPLEIYSLFDQEEMAREYLFKPYQLLDIHRIRDDELLRQQWWGVVAFALKNRQAHDFIKFFKELFNCLKKLCTTYPDSKVPEAVVEYAMNIRGEEDIELFKQISQQYLSSDIGDSLMGTIADVYRRQAKQEVWQQAMVEGRHAGKLEGKLEGRLEGKLEGRLEGRLEGKLEGRLEGQSDAFIKILKSRFGTIPSMYIKYIETANAETLSLWIENFCKAQTLNEIFEIDELVTE